MATSKSPQDSISIQRIATRQVNDAKAVITAGCIEFFGHPPLVIDDFDDAFSQYAAPSGIFLVLMDEGKVVGTGAIRRMDDAVCELKRMWFLPQYRGKGFGVKMTEALLDFARSPGYARVRLDSSPLLLAAQRLYARFGFYPIERYNDGPAAIFMEKLL